MSRWLIWWIAGTVSLLAGCASEPVAPPVTAHFARLSVEQREIPAPLKLPARPKGALLQCLGGEWMGFDLAGAAQLLDWTEKAEANTLLAAELAKAMEAADAERRTIVGAARMMESRANLLAEQQTYTDAALREERTAHRLDNLVNRLLLLLAIGAAL